ncbi:MAG: molybdate transporter substrate-binding protein [Bacillota bacterium]|nr:molybdate transporter substrate-binding protein [Bacillota bacterium]
MKKIISLILILCFVFSLSACKNDKDNTAEKSIILVAAASSLKNCLDNEIIQLFEEKYPNIKTEITYDSSGKLQAQIEQGAEVDVFISAAEKQMNALNDKNLILKDSVIKLLENKIVLIVPNDNNKNISTFEDVLKAENIAIGDPESVPAGQYAKETFENLQLWDEVIKKASLGTNVTEVLNWVGEGSADAGVVYSTDASSSSKIKVVSEAPEESTSKIIYPVGIIKTTKNQEVAKLFTEFLKSKEAINIFKSYGFTAYE